MVLDGCGLSVYPLLVLVGLNFLSVMSSIRLIKVPFSVKSLSKYNTLTHGGV